MQIKVGTAGWTIPRNVADQFPAEGSSLERYAARLPVAEINSSFHRPHRISTWERWRETTPPGFRFSVKLPKAITHQAKLVDCRDAVGAFLDQAHMLGDKLAVLLVQLPPKLELDVVAARAFFHDLESRTEAKIACEPRNMNWFNDEADSLLSELKVARVAADPAICDSAAHPGGWRGLGYWRLHGSPHIYRSSYSSQLDVYASRLLGGAEQVAESWCIFDNTASSAAAGDALSLLEQLE
jgi:uncharacterized protein YecE (DUF72 family)